MASTAVVPPASSADGGEPNPEDSNISSPLSEVDDGDANDDDMEAMHLDADDNDGSVLSDEDNGAAHDEPSESESALSDANSDIHSEANDTEAETERLYPSLLSRCRQVRESHRDHGWARRASLRIGPWSWRIWSRIRAASS